jgi:hypothetical protein
MTYDAMLSDTVLFNLGMAAVDMAVLVGLYVRRTPLSWWLGGFVGGTAAAVLMSLFARFPFEIVDLTADALFYHAAACLLGSALLLRKAAKKTAVVSALAAVLIVGVAVDAFLIEPTWLEVSHYRFASPKLSRPVRIVVLADLQTDECGPYERRVLEETLAQQPDLILLAGDYLQTTGEKHDRVQREINAILRELDFRAPGGVFAVEGNVDRGRAWPGLFRGLPILALRATQSLDVAGLRLTCLSERDSFRTDFELDNDDPERFHVVLGHCPNFAMGRVDADLLLAGHTHGGQVRLPWIGTLATGCLVPRSWAAGLTELPDGGKLLVSRGTGRERGRAPQIRFLCRPELVVIDLVPE